MMKNDSSDRLRELFSYYGVAGDISPIGNEVEILNTLEMVLKERMDMDNPIDLKLFVLLMSELSMSKPEIIDQNIDNNFFLDTVLNTILNSSIDSRSLCCLFDALRYGVSSLRSEHKPTDVAALKLSLQPLILSSLVKALEQDNPPHISLPGKKETYVKLSAVPISDLKSYTVSMWIKSPDHRVVPGFLLFRCRTPSNTLEAIVSHQKDTGFFLVLRITSEKRGREEIKAPLTLNNDTWQLITVKQCAKNEEGKNETSVYLDGSLVSEQELRFPFADETSETSWIFGLGFSGLISGATLYPEDLHPYVVSLHYNLGPYFADLSTGVSCPQSSFDSGHLMLGTQVAKGSLATRACSLTPIFTVKAGRLGPDARLPLVYTGKVYPDHIDMVPREPEHDQVLMINLVEDCVVVLNAGCLEAWVEAGGASLILYLFWAYTSSCGLNTNIMEQNQVFSCMKGVLQLLISLIERSADIKEQFIQLHGFHVMGHCLSLLPEEVKITLLDHDFIHLCLDLVRAFGPDSLKGDALSSALQGLLFDFRIWSSCEIKALREYLERLATQLIDSGSQLYKAIGIQRILDIFRLHVARKSPGKLPLEEQVEWQRALVDCADSVHRLLIITIDAAQAFALKLKGNLHSEAEMLLMCTEETSHSLIAERMLRLIGNLRITAPLALKHAMKSTRYHETTVVSLLMKKGFSIEVRSNALICLYWLLGEEFGQFPLKASQVRQALNPLLPAAAINSPNNTPGGPSSVKHRRTLSHVDANRLRTLKGQLKEILKPVDRVWQNIHMLAEIVAKSCDEGCWTVSETSKGENKTLKDEIDVLVTTVTHSGRVKVWLLLPLLPVLLVRCSLQTSQYTLMAVNVELKTESTHCEAVVSHPVRSWVKVFVALAALGESVLVRCPGGPEETVEGFGLVDSEVSPGSEASAEAREEAGNCVELALDCLSTLIEYKLRNHSPETGTMWQCIHSVLHSEWFFTSVYGDKVDKMKAEAVGDKYLKRVLVLVLQRLVKGNIDWDVHALSNFINILYCIDSYKLCGVFRQKEAPSAAPKAPQLLDLDFTKISPAGRRMQNHDESQILCFVMDLSSSLRRASTQGVMFGAEWRALKAALRVTVHCLSGLSDSVADRVMPEVVNQVGYMAEPWAPITAKAFKSILMTILTTLREIIHDPEAPDFLKGRYSALVFRIMHYFIDIRHSLSSGGVCPEHVLPTLDALMGVDSCNDIDLIFKLLDVTMRRAGSISFEDAEGDTGDSTKELEDGSSLKDCTTLPANDLVESSDDFVSVQNERRNEQGEKNTSDNDHNDISDYFQSMGFDGVVLEPTGNNPHPLNNNKSTAPAVTSTTTDLLNLDDVPATTSGPTHPGSEQPPIDLLSFDSMAVPTPATVSSVESSSSLTEIGSSASSAASPPVPPSTIVPSNVSITQQQSSLSAAEQAIANFSSRYNETDSNGRGNLTAWLKLRQGITSERVDSERARLARSMDALDLTSQATKKFWNKARRKVETELFQQVHRCQWKLGVAHEGHFFGRRRVVLRPRFDLQYGSIGSSAAVSGAAQQGFSPSKGAAPEDLGRALAKACAGYIQDVTRADQSSTTTGNGSDAGNLVAGEGKGVENVPVPGSGWGLVDADGSEEGGFGVVGLAEGAAPPEVSAQKSTPSSNEKADISGRTGEPEATGEEVLPIQSGSDMMGDVRQLEENLKQGKGAETGPCHPGTRRVGSGPAMLETKVIMITASGNFRGTLSFNGKEIFFSSTFEAEDGLKEDNAAVNLVKQRRMRRRRWVLASVTAIYMRRFRQRDSAMEVFFRKGKHRNFFVDFGHTKESARQRNDFARALMSAAPASAFKQLPTMSPQRMVYEHGVQEKWVNGQMSNFDYLMALNTIAGRSYNDLCQYPVMPWVLSDYSSKKLDLTDPSVYRDLSKPMGAINPTRLKEFLDRFNSFEENVSSGIPAFMFGSHYSTMVGVVLHFLVRLQPFAALHREMQNGHFDVPDRLFSSIPRAYRHNTTQLSEVKELTPEWFTTPEMFRNVNRFSLGQTQDGEAVGDVELPPWSETPEQFIQIHREALESPFVSAHLHEWIDLIFGYKQRGPDAVEACNVFYYLTYYGSVNHYMITDESLRKATELQIAHFGQTPMQLFRVPHPAKKKQALVRPLSSCFPTVNVDTSSPSVFLEPVSMEGKTSPVVESDSLDIFNDPVSNPAVEPSGLNRMVEPQNEEEQVCIEAPSTLVTRGHGLQPGGRCVLLAAVLRDRLVLIQENGVLEVLRYSAGEAVKQKLVEVAALGGGFTKRERGAGGREGEQEKRSSDEMIVLDDDIIDLTVRTRTPPPGKPPGDSEDGTSRRIIGPDVPVVVLQRDGTHFELIPRVPLPAPFNRFRGDGTPLFSSESLQEQAAQLLAFSRSYQLILSAGHFDGRVSIREIDTRTGFVQAAGDFRAHRRRVISIATDAIPMGQTDVVATCDEAGQLMVWTVLKAKSTANVSYNYVISRRPQRLFRVEPSPDTQCDISWQMGIVVASSGLALRIFSIERDELLRLIYLDVNPPRGLGKKTTETQDSATHIDTTTPLHQEVKGEPGHALPAGEAYGEGSSTGPEEQLFGRNRSMYLRKPGVQLNLSSSGPGEQTVVVRRLILCDVGTIVVHLEVTERRPAGGLLETGEEERVTSHMLVSYTLFGEREGYLKAPSPVTFLGCPDMYEMLLTGHLDGTVAVIRCQNLQVLFSFQPHKNCVSVDLNHVTKAGQGKGDGRNRRSVVGLNTSESIGKLSGDVEGKGGEKNGVKRPSLEVPGSPVVMVAVGNGRTSPAVICVTTEAGGVFLKPLPDFIKWEKVRSPSALAQLAQVPLLAVKDSLIQAQNWTTETAGVLAQNARSFADDALVELKKMNKNKLVKNVANFFGMGKADNESKSNK